MLRGSIQEIFGSVAIGLIFALYLLYFCYNILVIFNIKIERNGFRNWLLKETLKINTQGTTSLVIFLVFIYAMGQLVEDITDHITDTTKPKVLLPDLAASILISEETHRVNTLVDFDGKTKVTPLGQGLFKEEELIRSLAEKMELDLDLTPLIKDPGSYLKEKDQNTLKELGLNKLINSIYYRAKNWCYGQSTYFYELELIQRRVNFSRSTCLVSISLIVLTITLTLIQLLNLRRIIKIQSIWETKEENIKKLDSLRQQISFKRQNLLKSVCSLILLTFLLFTARGAYKITEENFNERAFGYYMSSLEESRFNSTENNMKRIEMKLDLILQKLEDK